MICSRFKVLPNDPLVQGLEPIQRLWILANMNEEFTKQQEALSGKDTNRINISSDGMDETDLGGLMRLAKHGG